MSNRNSLLQSETQKEILCYALGVIFSVVYCFCALNLWAYDFNVPFGYNDGDTLLAVVFNKRLLDGFFSTDLLGAPFDALQIDFPLYGDMLNYFARLILLLCFRGNVGYTINTFFISLYPSTFCTSFFVMRKLNISRWSSFLASVLYTALPYRFLRLTMHMDLSNFTFIPLCLYFCVLIYTKEWECRWSKKEKILLGLMLIPIALSGIYYAFFTCFFLVVTFILRYFKDRKISKLAVFCVIGIVGLIVLAMVPTIIQHSIYGANLESPERSPLEAEVYGLKITQFFIPNETHGISLLENLKQVYADAPLQNEGSEYLGIVGAIGLLLSLLTVMGFEKNSEKLQLLGKLNLGAILLATIGGFGSLFALLISPQIRAYNRISVFVAFFSMATFALLADTLIKRVKWKQASVVAVTFLCGISLVEQTIFQGDYLTECAESYYSDEKFVGQIEEYASVGAMIYQYPYHPFPESPAVNNMGDYALARGYLHSDTLKWSYGDYKGRNSDIWHRNLSAKSIPEQIETITVVGFEGIYIDTYAYTEEQLSKFTSQIEKVIGTTDVSFKSEDGRLLFYGLHDYRKYLESTNTEDELEWKKARYLVTSLFAEGFSTLEGTEESNWRWCDATGTLYVNNPSDKEIELTLRTMAATGYEAESNLQISLGDVIKNYTVASSGANIIFTCTLAPGENFIHFSTDAKRVEVPDDPREMYFRLMNPVIDLG